MLVYANSFDLNPPEGVSAVISQIAAWVGQTRKSFVDPQRLSEGIRELRFTDGASLTSLATRDDEGAPLFPYHFCACLMHGEPGVSGRRWVTEVGIKQATKDDTLQCSVLLRTDEISARVTAPIQVTRPRIVELLIRNCSPVGNTPGLTTKRLTEESSTAFGYEIERESRTYPLVEISCDREARYVVAPERLCSVLIGLAQVIDIPPEADTFKIEGILGRRYSAFGGAINIIFPFRRTEEGGFCKTVLLRPEKLSELSEAGATIESELLGIITHQTNLPHSWRHISSSSVREAILRTRLQTAALTARGSEELAAYEALLQEAADNLQEKDNEIGQLRDELAVASASLDETRSQIDGLKYALAGTQAKPDIEAEKAAATLAPLREAILAIVGGQPSLEEALRLVNALFADRIVVLETAFESAKESDRHGFRQGGKAVELLIKLCTDYWTALREGQGDQQARASFGKNVFAAKEAESLSNDGKRRRTFNYLGRDVIMEKHLKYGVKDSAAETLRIHFEWFAESKRIVIGHCGKHLDF